MVEQRPRPGGFVMTEALRRGVAALLLGLAVGTARAEDPASTPEAGARPDRFGHWVARCEASTEEQQGGCFIIQDLVLRAGGQRVLQVAVGYVPGSTIPIAALSLPLGMSLPAGIVLQAGDAAPLHFPVERCEPRGCRAGTPLAPDFLAHMAKAERLTVRFNDQKRQPVEVSVSLDGFSAGLASLKGRGAPPAPSP